MSPSPPPFPGSPGSHVCRLLSPDHGTAYSPDKVSQAGTCQREAPARSSMSLDVLPPCSIRMTARGHPQLRVLVWFPDQDSSP